MRHLALAVSAMVLVHGALYSQQASEVHQRTASPPNARFEIIQSELAARWTFRLDRFTGHVDQLVKSKGGDESWQDMVVLGLGRNLASTRAHFQLFTSGLAARHTYLIDTDTGKTWEIASGQTKKVDGSEEEDTIWQPFPE